MNKFIFLDIDGVLNSTSYYKRRDTKNYPYDEFDVGAISLLNELVNKTEAKVVVTSTWRQGTSLEELEDIMQTRGFEHEIFDYTPFLHYSKSQYTSVPRGCEIHEWLETNCGYDYSKVVRYVILDDDSDMLYWQREHFFHVDRSVGLTNNVVYKAIRYLNRV